MLDSDLTKLYNVKTKRINEQVKRNLKEFKQILCFNLQKIGFEFEINIRIMRVYSKLKQEISTNKYILFKVKEIELTKMTKYVTFLNT